MLSFAGLARALSLPPSISPRKAVPLKRVVCLVAVVALAASAEEKRVPTYTNEDLDRMRAHRDETGVASTVVAPPAPADIETHRGDKGEAYWRGQFERLEARLRPMRAKAAQLRLRVEEVRRRDSAAPTGRGRRGRGSASSGRSTTSAAALEDRLRLLEAEIRELESSFEERARRAGALPGWVR